MIYNNASFNCVTHSYQDLRS